MKKLSMLIAALVAVFAFANGASADDGNCGIGVEQIWYHCEYRYFPSTKATYRDGMCQNGDTLVLQMWLAPTCYNETGVVTATAMDPDQGYTIAWLNRPRYIRFSSLTSKYVEVRLQGIYRWTSNTEDGFKTVALQVTPVSSQNAAIIDDAFLYVGWQAQPGCDANGCG